MSTDNGDPEDDEKSLFRKAMRQVRPLNHDQPAAASPRRPRPVPKQRIQDDRQVMDDLLSDWHDEAELETGEDMQFARTGLQHNVLRKLRRGQFSLSAELDLHGLTVAEARIALTEFLHTCRLHHQTCVRIIHGKGFRSKHQKPVLKNKVNIWLRQRDEVLAFCSARPIDGGTGAVYVLLKKR